jgi:hypothetical protein
MDRCPDFTLPAIRSPIRFHGSIYSKQIAGLIRHYPRPPFQIQSHVVAPAHPLACIMRLTAPGQRQRVNRSPEQAHINHQRPPGEVEAEEKRREKEAYPKHPHAPYRYPVPKEERSCRKKSRVLAAKERVSPMACVHGLPSQPKTVTKRNTNSQNAIQKSASEAMQFVSWNV